MRFSRIFVPCGYRPKVGISGLDLYLIPRGAKCPAPISCKTVDLPLST